MENINKKNTSLTDNNNNLKYDNFKKVEWINYFNEGLIIESINNQINNSINKNKKIPEESINAYINKANININIIKNINNSNNKIKEKKELISNKEFYKNKNYYFSEIKELYGPKKILSFEYQEKITIDDYSDKLYLFKDKNKDKDKEKNKKGSEDEDFKYKKFNNIIVLDNKNENGKDNGNEKLNNKNNNNGNNKLRNRKNKSVDLKHNNSQKKNKDNKENKKNNNLSQNDNIEKNHNNKNNLKNNNKNIFRRYEPLSSYAKRHKMEKEYKINGHFHPNEEKPEIISKKILLGRTIPQMIVLNNYRLVNEDDYEMYQRIVNYNKLNNKRNNKPDLDFYNINYINNKGNIINDNYSVSDNAKINLNSKNNNEYKIKDENIKTSFI